jgi:predicted RNA-binding Zn-ribbon protein involved in translation (DUF1610 family)
MKDWVYLEELPLVLKCPKCGSTFVELQGAKKVEFTRKERDGKIVEEHDYNVEYTVVYSVECLNCGNTAIGEEIFEWRGMRDDMPI